MIRLLNGRYLLVGLLAGFRAEKPGLVADGGRRPVVPGAGGDGDGEHAQGGEERKTWLRHGVGSWSGEPGPRRFAGPRGASFLYYDG